VQKAKPSPGSSPVKVMHECTAHGIDGHSKEKKSHVKKIGVNKREKRGELY